jgi:hypothetical protein
MRPPGVAAYTGLDMEPACHIRPRTIIDFRALIFRALIFVVPDVTGNHTRENHTEGALMRTLTLVFATALAVLAVLAVCLMDPASAATRRSGYQGANPDRGPYPASSSCAGTTCFRSGSQKIQKHHKKH